MYPRRRRTSYVITIHGASGMRQHRSKKANAVPVHAFSALAQLLRPGDTFVTIEWRAGRTPLEWQYTSFDVPNFP